MKHIHNKITYLLLFLKIIILPLILFSGTDVSTLEKKFQTPPDSAKPHTWWHWMNGNVTGEGITKDLEEMKKVGLGGAQMFHVTDNIPHGPVGYFSKEWRELMKHSVETANRLGLEICFHNCAGWSSSGGPWIKPEFAMQEIVSSEIQIKGPKKFNKKLKQPPTKHDYYKEIAVFAFPTPKGELDGNKGFRIKDAELKTGYVRKVHKIIFEIQQNKPEPGSIISKKEIINISKNMSKDGHLNWSVPNGDWTIIRFGHTPQGFMNKPAPEEGTGLECDKLSKDGAEAHWYGIVDVILKDVGPLAGKTLNNILIDSYEVRHQNWTKKFAEEFKKRRRYDCIPYLVTTTGRVVESLEITERFLWDFRRTIADLFAENYYGHFATLCKKNGLVLSAEPYGRAGNFDDFANGAVADIPMGEFWVGRKDSWTWWSSKLASSLAHTYGRKYVGAEAFTAGPEQAGWRNHPYTLKAKGDYFFAKGLNRLIFHDYAHQPWTNTRPGMTMGPHGINFEWTATWWEQAPAWTGYLTRCQYLLQEGKFVGDLAYLLSENSPNTLARREQLIPVPPDGYDYDAVNTELLFRMKVKNNKLTLPTGMSYTALILPHDDPYMQPEVLKKVKELVQNGAIVFSPKPKHSPSLSNYPKCDKEIKKIADELWGTGNPETVDKKTGQGRVVFNKSLKNLLEHKGLQPDFSYKLASGGDGHPNDIVYIHRKVDDADYYFLSNQTHQYLALNCTFRVKGRTPEYWDAESGKTKKAAVYQEKNGLTTLPVMLGPAGSVFVIFRDSKPSGKHIVSVTRKNKNALAYSEQTGGKFKIISARYGDLLTLPPIGKGKKKWIKQSIKDVTKELQAMIKNNQLTVKADNTIVGDPAKNVVKQLEIVYSVNNTEYTRTIKEKQTITLPEPGTGSAFPLITLDKDKKSGTTLNAWESGSYQITLSDGSQKNISIPSIPNKIEIQGSWEVKFPSGWGAPEKNTFTKLISWTEHSHEDIKYFSGTATYLKDFKIAKDLISSDKSLWLDLGKVKNIAVVSVNGKDLGIIWKPPFRVDISKAVKPGDNTLEVKVVNNWPNRLIGDEQKPDPKPWKLGPIKPWNPRSKRLIGPDADQWDLWVKMMKEKPDKNRYTWTTWKYFSKDSPLYESGLLGPVIVRVVIKKEIQN